MMRSDYMQLRNIHEGATEHKGDMMNVVDAIFGETSRDLQLYSEWVKMRSRAQICMLSVMSLHIYSEVPSTCENPASIFLDSAPNRSAVLNTLLMHFEPQQIYPDSIHVLQ